MKRYGEMLRAGREALGLSQRRLAAELNISPPYMCQVERGERPPLDEQGTKRAADLLQLGLRPLLSAALRESGWPVAGRLLLLSLEATEGTRARGEAADEGAEQA